MKTIITSGGLRTPLQHRIGAKLGYIGNDYFDGDTAPISNLLNLVCEKLGITEDELLRCGILRPGETLTEDP